MKKLITFLIVIICLTFNNYLTAETIRIIIKVENEIITNIDIDNEVKYLTFLNPKLNDLEKSKLNDLAKDSVVSDVIKKRELKKNIDFEKSHRIVEIIESNLIKSKRIKNKSEFLSILENKNLDYEVINEKLKIEGLWNKLIYEKYISNVKINKSELRDKIIYNLNNKKNKFEYNLSEIMIVDSDGESINSIIKKVNINLEQIGFENTANILSVSSSSKNGGLIGWINELQLSKKVKKEVEKLEVGQITNPINIQNGYLLIKLNDKRELTEKINIEDQLDKLINKEKNRQLNTFSNILYKRLKKNIEINEY
tara:strand:- start:849 stop:1781 length:933 start_codon:yes stop_codon:yes gene_type:complete